MDGDFFSIPSVRLEIDDDDDDDDDDDFFSIPSEWMDGDFFSIPSVRLEIDDGDDDDDVDIEFFSIPSEWMDGVGDDDDFLSTLLEDSGLSWVDWEDFLSILLEHFVCPSWLDWEDFLSFSVSISDILLGPITCSWFMVTGLPVLV